MGRQRVDHMLDMHFNHGLSLSTTLITQTLIIWFYKVSGHGHSMFAITSFCYVKKGLNTQ